MFVFSWRVSLLAFLSPGNTERRDRHVCCRLWFFHDPTSSQSWTTSQHFWLERLPTGPCCTKNTMELAAVVFCHARSLLLCVAICCRSPLEKTSTFQPSVARYYGRSKFACRSIFSMAGSFGHDVLHDVKGQGEKGFPREGVGAEVGAEKCGLSLEARETKFFLAGYPGILPGYPGGAPEKFERKNCVQFSSSTFFVQKTRGLRVLMSLT